MLNLHKQPTVYTLLGRDDFDPEELREEIFDHCRAGACPTPRTSRELCEQRLGSKQFVNIMMLGVAYQLGLIPVSASSIAWAIKDTIRRDHRKNLKAFNIGRKLALEPRALPIKPEPRDLAAACRPTRAASSARPQLLGPTLRRALREARQQRDEA